MNGGYDDGYRSCPCFWGTTPGSLFQPLTEHLTDLQSLHALDAGCGEGKNAVFLASKGASVRAVDISAHAIANARAAWPDQASITWEQADIRRMQFAPEVFDVVVAYGLLHCFDTEAEVSSVVDRLQQATIDRGYHVVCTFNNRHQDLRAAHPDFRPLLLPHSRFMEFYSGWTIIHASDKDLHETHPHNNIPHVHSLTRLVARKG